MHNLPTYTYDSTKIRAEEKIFIVFNYIPQKELALESNLEKSRALVMLYTGADERYGSKLSSFIAYGCI